MRATETVLPVCLASTESKSSVSSLEQSMCKNNGNRKLSKLKRQNISLDSDNNHTLNMNQRLWYMESTCRKILSWLPGCCKQTPGDL